MAFASSMLAQFDANMRIVEMNPTARKFKRSRYRLTMDREADSATDGVYFLDLQSAEPQARWFGAGKNVWRGRVNVQIGFSRGGGDMGGHRGGDRRTVLDSASNDSMKIADVCQNPINYNRDSSGIRVVNFVRFARLFDLPHREVWQVEFDVEWEHDVILS